MSSVIKAGTMPREAAQPNVHSVAFSFADMKSQADEYVQQVRAEAAKIVQAAQAEAAKIRKQAEEQGQRAALATVDRVIDEKVGKHMQTLMPALQKALRDIQQSRQEWLTHWHHIGVKTACAIAERIVRRELQTRPEITLDLVREALEMAAGCAEMQLRLNPDDYHNLRAQVDGLTSQIAQVAPTTIIPDTSIEPGGCRLETKFGSIDQQIKVQLARIEQELIA